MDRAKLGTFKRKIEQELKSCSEEILKLKELTKPISPENSLGRLTRMEGIQEKSVNEAALRNVQNRVLRLERALERIESEEYGICQICEEEIPEGRLNSVLDAVACIECMEKHGG